MGQTYGETYREFPALAVLRLLRLRILLLFDIVGTTCKVRYESLTNSDNCPQLDTTNIR